MYVLYIANIVEVPHTCSVLIQANLFVFLSVALEYGTCISLFQKDPVDVGISCANINLFGNNEVNAPSYPVLVGGTTGPGCSRGCFAGGGVLCVPGNLRLTDKV